MVPGSKKERKSGEKRKSSGWVFPLTPSRIYCLSADLSLEDLFKQ